MMCISLSRSLCRSLCLYAARVLPLKVLSKWWSSFLAKVDKLCNRLAKDIFNTGPPRALMDNAQVIQDEGLRKTVVEPKGVCRPRMPLQGWGRAGK